MVRRQFLAALGATALKAASTTKADLLLYNATIHTMDRANPEVSAVAVAGDRFLAAGTLDDLSVLASATTKRIDLTGATVVPGFIDAHTHVASSGLRHLQEVDCDLRSIAAIQQAIRERAMLTPPGQWVVGFKYDDTKTIEGRPMNKADLDAAAPNHPVYISHRGGHTGYVNSKAYESADVNERTPDPKGGRFDRTPDGKLAGRVSERASEPFHRKIPSKATRDDRREGVKLISKMFVKTGVTSTHDAQGTPDDLRAYQDALEAGDLSIRVYCLINYRFIDSMITAGIRTGLGNEWIRVGAMKLVCDGSLSERTARVSVPYVGRPKDFGILVTDEDEMYTYARKAHAAGWQIGTHCNGDVGIDQTLRVYERVQREIPRHDPRFRLEHCSIVNDSLIRRIKALGAIPMPFSTYAYYHGEKMREYGAERLNSMFAVRSFLDAGINVTQASDYPPGPFEPMMALQSSVTRADAKGTVWGPKQRVTVQEALRVGTIHGAYASYEEHLKGSIEPGKLADLVVLGRDPYKEDPFSLITIPIQRTMVGGKWAYEA